MTGQTLAAVLSILCLLHTDLPAADPKQSALRWTELSGVLVDKRIALTLADGTRLEGDALAVRADELVLDIRKTSNRQTYPKGQGSVPRSAISSVKLIRTDGAWKVAGGASGAALAVAFMILGVYYESALLGYGGFILGLPLGIIAGYHLGKAADRRAIEIRILPDPEGRP